MAIWALIRQAELEAELVEHALKVATLWPSTAERHIDMATDHAHAWRRLVDEIDKYEREMA